MLKLKRNLSFPVLFSFIGLYFLFIICLTSCIESINVPHACEWKEWVQETAATCSSEGAENRVCVHNSKHIETRQIAVDINAHDWEYDNDANPPTCITDGHGKRDCNICNESEIFDGLPMLGHNFIDNWIVTIDPTCTEEGEEERTCEHDDCNEQEIQQILPDPDAHDWEYDYEAVPPTCTTDGNGIRECNFCNIDEPVGNLPMLGHNWNEWGVTTPPACTVAGEDTRGCINNECSEFETRIIDVIGHNFGGWIMTTPPACTVTGEDTRNCINNECSEFETRPIDASGHEFGGDLSLVLPPTCTEAGVVTRNCIYRQCIEIEALPIDAIGHSFGSWIMTTSPACTVAGKDTRSCINNECSEFETRPIDAIGHSFGSWIMTTPSTCTVAGEDTRSCQREDCDEKEIRSIAAGHNWNLWVLTVSPTCTATGIDTRNCIRIGCFETETRLVAATGHNWEWIETIPAEINNNGLETYTCKNCSQANGTRILYATGTPGLQFSLQGGTYTVRRGTVTSGEVFIPEYYRPNSQSSYQRVTQIGTIMDTIYNGAFANNSGITTVHIPLTVTRINSFAFYNCSGLTSITIPNSVTSIGFQAFQGCNNLTYLSIPFVGDSLNSTTNTHFGYIFGARYSSDQQSSVPRSLKTVIITGGNRIYFQAFDGCWAIQNITIPNSVTNIGRAAFRNCTSLTNLTIPFIGESLNSTTNTHFGFIFGATDYSNQNINIPYSLDTVTITGGSKVDANAFQGCRTILDINLPDSLTEIGANAFSGCIQLRSVIIPDNVTSIGSGAFFGCGSFTNMVLPSNLTIISNAMFSGCSSLRNVTILAQTPPTLQQSVFSNTHIDLRIEVPAVSVEAYKTAVNWSSWAHRIFPIQ